MLPERPESEHIVHVGTFGNWDCTDPHFTWHQLVEAYIEASGIAWTHLHPNVFMEVLANFMHIRNDVFRVYWGDRRVGWIAARDIAAVAATVLCEGPQKQGGQNYWLSAQVAARRIDERNVVPWGDFGSGVGVHSVPSPATRSERKSNPVRNLALNWKWSITAPLLFL